MHKAALPDDQADPFICWETIALDVELVSPAGHVAIMVEAQLLWARTGAGDEPALVDVQDLDDLLGDVVNQTSSPSLHPTTARAEDRGECRTRERSSQEGVWWSCSSGWNR